MLRAEAVLLLRRGNLPQNALTHNLAQSMKWLCSSRYARALSERDTVREGRQVRAKGGGTKGGSLTVTTEIRIATVR